MLHDVRMALRSLRRAPGFTATTLLTLALAAAANAAILAVVYGVLLKPLPYRDPDRLVLVWPQQFQSNADLQFARERGRMFASLASIAPGWTMALGGAGEPAKITVGRVSPNMFSVLGAQPMLGGVFDPDGTRSAAVVLSHRLWISQFGGDPQAIGRMVQLDGVATTILGVMPPAFDVLGLRSDAYTPLVMDEGAWYHRLTFSFFVGRLADGWTREQASDQYAALVQQMKRERNLAGDFGRDARVVDLQTAMVGDMRTTLLVLAAAVGAILLIAGVNIATLQLTRRAGQARDVAIQTALGASRTRIMRQAVAESLVIALAAGVFGLLAARLLLGSLLALLPPTTPRLAEVQLDPLIAVAVVLAATVVNLLAAVGPLFGNTVSTMLPLLRATTASEGRQAKRLRAGLVAVEVAVAVVLATGAGLMVRTMSRLTAVDPGFRVEGLLTLHLQPSASKLSRSSVANYYGALLERVRGVPGVSAAGAIQHLPFSGYSWTTPIEVEGHTVAPGAAMPTVETRTVTPGYLVAMQQPVIAGRDIVPADASRTDVVLVNEAFAARFFGSPAAALGRTVRTRGNRGLSPRMTIAGVVGNVRHNTLMREAGPEIYTPAGGNTIPAMMIAIRLAQDADVIVPAVRDTIRAFDPDVPVSDIQMMDAKIAASLGRPRLLLSLLAAFAGVGLVLAVIGVYGVVAFSVAQRWREIGIKVALGAARRRIIATVVGEALLYGTTGVAAGLAAALWASRAMQSVVWGVSTTDAVTYVSISALTLLVVSAAALRPALRAADVDPAEALKRS